MLLECPILECLYDLEPGVCYEHDGRHLVTDPNFKGKVCINCALKVNYCKKVIMVFFFLILFMLLAFMITLIFVFDDETRGVISN